MVNFLRACPSLARNIRRFVQRLLESFHNFAFLRTDGAGTIDFHKIDLDKMISIWWNSSYTVGSVTDHCKWSGTANCITTFTTVDQQLPCLKPPSSWRRSIRRANGQIPRPHLEHKDRYSVTFISKTDQANQQHRKSLQKISINLILKTLRPLGICGTSDSKSENNDAGTMETPL